MNKNFLNKTLPLFRYSLLKQESITLTDACIQSILKRKKQQQFLRLSVEGGEGCQGYKYNFIFDSKLNDEDLVIKKDENIIFTVDEETMRLVEGAVVDYEDKMIRAAFFVQENPNADKSCSCKTSFSPKNNVL